MASAALAESSTPSSVGSDFDEQVLEFSCAGTAPLVGVLAAPQPPASADALGVVIIVGGPQYRAGSHRQFVHLARALAAAGYPALRFDVRGMGDSAAADPSPLRGFQDINDDIAAAIEALLQARPSLRGVALWGLCDGASAALLYSHERADSRVKALALANPWVRSQASLARTHVKHYYRQRLMERAFWAKLVRGGMALQALRGLWSNLRVATRGTPEGDALVPFQDRMAVGWAAFDGSILLLSSGQDLTAREFDDIAATQPRWQAALSRRAPQVVRVPEADHTFSAPAAQAAAEAATVQWLAGVAAASASMHPRLL